jgi:thioredoxin-like negative regulator of GroEL
MGQDVSIVRTYDHALLRLAYGAPRMPTALTADNFAARLSQSSQPALVHCMAQWAAPCRAQADEIATLARVSSWRFKFYTLDVHREEELAAAFAIRTVPTLLVVQNARILERFSSFQNAARLRSALIAAEVVSVKGSHLRDLASAKFAPTFAVAS